jgi:hypothetical protein
VGKNLSSVLVSRNFTMRRVSKMNRNAVKNAELSVELVEANGVLARCLTPPVPGVGRKPRYHLNRWKTGQYTVYSVSNR